MKKISLLVLVAMIFMLSFASCTLLVDTNKPTDSDQTGDNNTHEHAYGTDWSYNSTKHYHACECGEKSAVADHTAGNDGKCTVCGYQVSEPVSVYTVTIVAPDTVTTTKSVVEVNEGENVSFVALVSEEYNLTISGAKVLGEPSVKNGVKSYAVIVFNVTSDLTVEITVTVAPCSHEWIGPTCTAPKTCEKCGKTEGSELGHNYLDATCTEPSTCDGCGETFGLANGHKGGEATCEDLAVCDVCGEKYGELADHNWSSATCEAAAVCTVCGATGDAALGHSWVDADCDTPKTCSKCFATEGEALGHDWVDPTCTRPGYCSVCSTLGNAATGHSWKDADCTTPKTCLTCSATQGNPLGHSWTDATCTTPETCSLCGITQGDVASHNYVGVVTAPKCEEGGYTTYTCSACSHSYVGDETAPAGHKASNPTCTEDSVCSVCEKVLAEKTGHSYTETVTPPTCTANGYTLYTCSNCGHSYTDNKVNATGHSGGVATCTSLAVCASCGKTYGELGSHNYDAVVTAPKCESVGFTTHTCTSCGDSYTDNEVAAKGHSYNSVVTAPKCEEGGYTTYTCTACGDTYTADETAATGHNYQAVVTDPECEEGGYTTYTCTYCGNTYVDDYTDPVGHSWIDATYIAPKTCSSCGATEGEPLKYVLVLGDNDYRVSTDANGVSQDITVTFTATEPGTYKITTTDKYNRLATLNGEKLIDTYYEFEVTEESLVVTFKIGTANPNANITNDIHIVLEKVEIVDPTPGDSSNIVIQGTTDSTGAYPGSIEIPENGVYVFTTDIANSGIYLSPDGQQVITIEGGQEVALSAGTYQLIVMAEADTEFTLTVTNVTIKTIPGTTDSSGYCIGSVDIAADGIYVFTTDIANSGIYLSPDGQQVITIEGGQEVALSAGTYQLIVMAEADSELTLTVTNVTIKTISGTTDDSGYCIGSLDIVADGTYVFTTDIVNSGIYLSPDGQQVITIEDGQEVALSAGTYQMIIMAEPTLGLILTYYLVQL